MYKILYHLSINNLLEKIIVTINWNPIDKSKKKILIIISNKKYKKIIYKISLRDLKQYYCKIGYKYLEH